MTTKKQATPIMEEGFREYLEYNNNTVALQYMENLEKGGHKLSVKGGGYTEYVILETVQGYDVFESDENKAIFAEILQMSSAAGNAASVIAYCIIPGSAHYVVKGDNLAAVKTYTRVICDMFVKRYDKGKQSIGYPFRVAIKTKEIHSSNALWNAIATVYGYSPVDFRNYPYNSYAFISQGSAVANMIIGVELNIIQPRVFTEELLTCVSYGSYFGGGREKLNVVLEDMKKRYVYPYARIKEDTLALIIGETCVRTGMPYIKVAKKMKVYRNRHDLVVTTLCSYMIRRKATFDMATSELSLGSENHDNLCIETLAEINRLTGYSYEYIMKHMMCMPDPNYGLLITTFQHLHKAYGWEFAELCVKFHIARDTMYIGQQCGF